MHLLNLLVLATAATAGTIQKRCTPQRDPDVYNGYYPPAPCWQTFDPGCQPHLRQGTEMTLDAKHSLAVVYGVEQFCQAEIDEELARERDGRKNWNWLRLHGNLTFIEPDILVISGMPESVVQRYQKLTYWP